MVCVTSEAVWWIREKLVDDDVAQRTAADGYRGYVSLHAISGDVERRNTGASELAWYQHVNLIEPG
jgi:hypothetical protein